MSPEIPLNKTKGEILGEMGPGYVIVPNEKVHNLAAWDHAYKHAQKLFKRKGALLPIHIAPEDALVQVYPVIEKIAFLFQRRIAGKLYFSWSVFGFDAKMKAYLREKEILPRVN